MKRKKKQPARLQLIAPRDRVLFFKSLPGLSGVPTGDLIDIARWAEEVKFKKGDYLLEQGEPFDGAYILVTGTVGLYKDGERIDIYEAPASVGVMGILAALDGAPGDVVALDDCITLMIPPDRLLGAYESNFTLIRNALRLSARLVVETRNGLPFNPDSPPDAVAGERPEKPMDFVDRLKELSEGVFKDANLEGTAEWARHTREHEYEPGDLIWSEGDQSGFFLQIRHGLVNVSRKVDGPTTTPFKGVVGSDYSFGFFESLGSTPRTYSAIAKTDVIVLRTDMDVFLSILEEHFDMAMSALATISGAAVDLRWSVGAGATQAKFFAPAVRADVPTFLPRF